MKRKKTHFNELLISVVCCFYHQDVYQMARKNGYHMDDPIYQFRHPNTNCNFCTTKSSKYLFASSNEDLVNVIITCWATFLF